MRSLIQTILISFSFLLLFNGCTKTPNIPVKIEIDTKLPAIVINGTLQDRNAIAFEWRAIDNATVKGIHVYRDDPASKDLQLHRIDTIESRYATHYVDNTVSAGLTYKYRFSTYSDRGFESTASETITVSTLAKLEPVSFFASINSMPRSAKLIWRPHSNSNIKEYILEKKSNEQDSKYVKVATIKGRLSAEYVDKNLKDNATYYYRLKAVTYDKQISNPTTPEKVITKPLPKKVQSVTATLDKPNQIIIKWQENTEEDLAFYNIYRSESATGTFNYHVKLEKTSFIDKIKENGKSYFYKISAVDTDNLESLASDIVKGSSLARPETPIITSSIITDKSARLHWNKIKRADSYVIVKTTKYSWINKDVREIQNIAETQFTDVNVIPETQYFYTVIAVDKNGIRSLPSKEQDLIFEKVKP